MLQTHSSQNIKQNHVSAQGLLKFWGPWDGFPFFPGDNAALIVWGVSFPVSITHKATKKLKNKCFSQCGEEELDSTPFGMNWSNSCEPGLNSKHHTWISVCSSCCLVENSSSQEPKSGGKPSQRSRSGYSSRSAHVVLEWDVLQLNMDKVSTYFWPHSAHYCYRWPHSTAQAQLTDHR